MLSGDDLSGARIAGEVAALRQAIEAGLDGAEAEVTYDLRYRGQAFELAVPGPSDPDPADLTERFAAEHERRYGYRDPEADVELVNVRLAMVVPGPSPEPEGAPPGSLDRAGRRARFAGEWLEAEVLRGEPETGLEVDGPSVFELPEATMVLPPGWRARVDGRGTIVAEQVV
jgi:N-methylhydantoinase A